LPGRNRLRQHPSHRYVARQDDGRCRASRRGGGSRTERATGNVTGVDRIVCPMSAARLAFDGRYPERYGWLIGHPRC
jgi:hypothetical protein